MANSSIEELKLEQLERLEQDEQVLLYYRQALAQIAGELDSLRTGAEHLQVLYGAAAISSDLTFIKILEERYESLTEEIRAFEDVVAAVQTNMMSDAKEEDGDGR